MAIGETNAPGSVVVGTRLPFWKSMGLGEMAFEVASPFLIIWAAVWFVGLARGCGHLTDDANVGHTVWGTIFFSVVAIVGISGASMIRTYLKTIVLVSTCPHCGVQRQRNFDAKEAYAMPTRCGECNAYLWATGVEVREERSDATNMSRLYYELEPERFLPVAQRDEGGFLQFAMPAMCAVCGSTDATDVRAIGNRTTVASPNLGAVDAVASAVGREVSDDIQRYQRGYVVNSTTPTRPSSDQIDAHLRHLRAPVCAKHTVEAESWGHAIAFSSGKLVFASYGYYMAFCALNHVSDTKPPAAG